MYELIPWSSKLDLTDFYTIAEKKGYTNNASQHMLVDCFNAEEEKQVWILYYEKKAVGSVAAHSLDLFDRPSYRICARTCVFTDLLPYQQLRALKFTCQYHQNITGQFFIPTCIEWAPSGSDLYITSNNSSTGSQRLVHNIYCPALADIGTLEFCGNKFYRGLDQSFWRLNINRFYKDLNKYPRWN